MTRQKRLTKEERMRQIRNHAKNVFLRKGFDKTTMEDVVEETGMSKGGVYRHYSSTTEMLYDLMIDGNIYRNTLIDEYLENNKDKNKFEQMGEILLDKALASTDLMKLYGLILSTEILDARESFDSQREFLKDTIVNYIRRIEHE